MYDGPDIVWARSIGLGVGGWVVTRHSLIEEVLLDPVRFSSRDNAGVAAMLGMDWRLIPLEVDPPAHADYRRILQPWFQPAAINAIEARLRRTVRELLDGFEQKGECEFVSEFAALFPSYVVLELMGLPRELLTTFLEWENAYIHAHTPEQRTAAIKKIASYIDGYVAKRRIEPKRDDLVNAILEAEIRGRPITEAEAMGMIMILYTGGLDTVLSSLGWYFRYLASDPALQSHLRENPDEIPAAVEELMRAFGVVGSRRTVASDFNFHSVPMREGDKVIAPGFLAGRDPRQYREPHKVLVDRGARHLTLATGPHNCIGGHLARREIRIVLEELLGRLRNIRIAPGAVALWSTEGVWTVKHLPLVWDPP